ncbi:glycosyltransferase [Pedobacter boryungensis]|uniref:Glycosyltransferase n=1 Tax=Pedobacter boryungensis TaxID=869962 RepID=A0ABX2DF85_9SPHI|nr:glycosyltransferase [Pedobacter boryungensis]NQX32746.1 glycosyltransferase [Pedobacter boryungensis]
MKRFLTIFPIATNVHLIKDVGMIPYILHKELNYESTFLCYKNDDYSYLEKEVKGLHIVYLKKIFHNQLLDVLFFLLFNQRKYDVFQVYQLSRVNLILCFFIKIYSFCKRKTYLKLDADDQILSYLPSKITKYLLKGIDIVSIENQTYLKHLNLTMQLGRKIDYVPNGFYDNGVQKSLNFNKKENKIITVGRIGTKQKATEILCEAFREFSIYNQEWKLEIIGPIENEFKPFIAHYFKQNPNLKHRVTFTGPINNREVLEDYYATAKVFALTSRYEGFPLVLTEAAKFGCFIISTDLPAVRDLIDGNQYGNVFPINDHHYLAALFKKISDNPHILEKLSSEFQSFAYKHFYWPKICRTIDKLL